MRIIVLLILIGFTSLTIGAQTETYQGLVLDANSKETIPFATVAIYNNAILVNGTTTNENGQFKLKVEEVFSHFDISFIGYENEVVRIRQEKRKTLIQITFKEITN